MEKNGYVLITGAGSGLGKSLSIEFCKRGYFVALVGKTISKLQAVSDICTKGNTLILGADVSNYEDVEKCFIEANSWKGHPIMVISCAGEGVFGQVGSFTNKHLERVFSGNLLGTIFTSQRAFLEMKANGGTIVNVMSTAATIGRANESIYCASKWGAKGFTESLRLETKGTKVKVVAVYPGGMNTPFWSDSSGMTPDTKGFMNPDEVATVLIDNLLNKESLYIADIIVNRI